MTLNASVVLENFELVKGSMKLKIEDSFKKSSLEIKSAQVKITKRESTQDKKGREAKNDKTSMKFRWLTAKKYR